MDSLFTVIFDTLPECWKNIDIFPTQQYYCVMIPNFKKNGNLPPGIFEVTWEEFNERFGFTAHRKWLIDGLKIALQDLSYAGCKMVFINGSFVTSKKDPGDYDLCWSIKEVNTDRLNSVLLDFSPRGRIVMKEKYRGDIFPAEIPEGLSGKVFLDFFQTDKETGETKGIIALKIGGDHD